VEKLRLHLPLVLLIVLLAALAWLGAAGTDVGEHWDEVNITRAVTRSLADGQFLPHWYNYPSLAYDVSVLAAVPHVVANASHPDSAAIVTFLSGPRFTLELRRIFFVLCTLGGLAVFLVTRRLTGSGWAGLFAALALTGSWEFTYQARWVAPDGIVLLFAAFSLWAQHHVLEPRGSRSRSAWRTAAAVFAGLAGATKYPGILVLVPLFVAIGANRSDDRPMTRLAQCLRCGIVALLAFLVASPGCLLEFTQAIPDLLHEVHHYSSGHGGNTVSAGLPHFLRLATYLALVFLSSQPAIAITESVLVLAGMAGLFRRDAKAGLWLLSFPVAYLFWITSERVMIVRNALVLLPWLATLAALGLLAAWDAARAPALRRSLVAVAIAIVAYDVGFAMWADASVRSPNPTSQQEALVRDLAAHPGTHFYLAPACRAMVGGAATNTVTDIARADRFVFLTSEVKDWHDFAANRPGRYHVIWRRWMDVNWDYYPSWIGSPAILDVATSDHEAMGR
jgi:4-amino-4-deoxy-L-arabinose transferase-like glycosyltransferase